MYNAYFLTQQLLLCAAKSFLSAELRFPRRNEKCIGRCACAIYTCARTLIGRCSAPYRLRFTRFQFIHYNIVHSDGETDSGRETDRMTERETAEKNSYSMTYDVYVYIFFLFKKKP